MTYNDLSKEVKPGEQCPMCGCIANPSPYYRPGSRAYCPHCHGPSPMSMCDPLWASRCRTYANNFSPEAKERRARELQEKYTKKYGEPVVTSESPKPEIIPHDAWRSQVERFRYALLNA